MASAISASAARGVVVHLGARRPRRVAARDGRGFGVGVDAAREDRFEVLVDARLPEPLLDQRVDGERRQVAFVEDDRVAQRDRPLVVGGLVEQVEQRARAGAAALEAVEDGRPVERHKSPSIP